MEVDEEDRAFFEEHSAFATSFLGSDPLAGMDQKGKGKGKKDQPPPPPPQAPAQPAPQQQAPQKKKKKKTDKAAEEEEEDAAAVPIEPKSMRRNASTQGWDTARGVGNKVIKERLPTKTIDGTIQFRTDEVEDEEEEEGEAEAAQEVPKEPQQDEQEEEEEEEDEYDDDDSVVDSDASESAAITGHLRAAKATKDVASGPTFAEAANSLSLDAFGGNVRALRRARLELKKVELATLCESMLEDPEAGLLSRSGSGGGKGKGSKMSCLLLLLEDDDVKVQVLAMASLLAVFKDLAPAYRIRLPTEKELQIKASKEVRKARDYDRTLLSTYQTYLKHLEKASKKQTITGKKSKKASTSSTSDPSGAVAAKCLCELLTALPHFNFTTNLLAAVIRLGLGPDAATRAMAAQAVRRLLERDRQGDVSLTATKLICKEVQNRQLHAPDDVVRALQGLKLRVKEDEAEEVLRKAKLDAKKRKPKHSKEQDDEDEEGQGDILAGLKEAEARADPALRARCQAESLQEMTLLYFRVLKQAKRPTLLPAALEGLSRIAHLINLDTVIDVLDVLKDLLDPSRHTPLEASLHAVLTALRTLQGPGRELKVDDKAFLTFLYHQLGRVGTDNTSKRAALFPLLVTCLRAALLERREFSLARVAAFYKRLAGIALHLLSPQEAQIVLGLVKELATRYPGLDQMLDAEADRMAMGVYKPEALEPEMSNPLATGAWELTLLKAHHYHAGVKKAAVAAVAAAAASSGHEPMPWTTFRPYRGHDALGGGVLKEEEDLDFLKHGFGGMFARLPRQNPLHGMVRRAEREKRGSRVKLYFVQKLANPEILEGSTEAHKARLLHGVGGGKGEGKGSAEAALSFKPIYRETQSHARKITLCRKLQRSRAVLKAYEKYSTSSSAAAKKGTKK